ncbi:MotA/TolQ/ExbB proton channel family protein [Pseudohongiella sp.]|uniref:MotA/TolQ/ExbB proton channel domain-containing protein n=1 Tax=marine sediment metagenome TaxID=412755 RepID=A0A0F9YVT4_9ZZZZ|nr:MotA/TolQ/ExbB proton channel family protein [Pseudohongiella sp.]HDZ08034.1 MotA/TolQ/ExbB proton channel family protein [Pseudohongiella sp.]HEA64123.1 MotA/TolQ/ExbB proton channel family protein [Pseudohongiella sp.]
MKQKYLSEVIYQIFALIIVVIVVHAIYVAVIRPNADIIQQQQTMMQEADEDYVPDRSMYIVLRDFEQETCIILFFWALSIIGMKTVRTMRERSLLDRELLQVSDGTSILPEDTRHFARPVQALPERERSYLLPRALLAGLHRFGTTRDVQDVSATVRDICDNESERLESELAIVRYIAWAIPSIGFLGTVRGIGTALGQAHQAVTGDILGVTVSLGVAFNSTFVALVTSIVLMFLLYQLSLVQDRLVMDSQTYCDDHLIRYLQMPGRSTPQSGHDEAVQPA